jgi:predicted DNA-binding antitoxin AbrB/MazE fold protein
MTTTVEAIYENGVLKPAAPLALPERARVHLTIETDSERRAWLIASEASLAKVWDNDADDVFNELRDL